MTVVAATVLTAVLTAVLREPGGEGPSDGLRAAPSSSVSSEPGAGRPPGPEVDHPAATAAALARLEQALRHGDPRAARALGSTAAGRRLAAALARNAARLHVVDVDVRAVGTAHAAAAQRRRWSAGTWLTRVRVAWRYAQVDRRPVVSDVRVALTPSRSGAGLATVLPAADGQTPSWLLEPLEVRRRPRVLVSAAGSAVAAQLATAATDALAAVGRRLPGWHGDLVVEAPGAVPVFRAASGLDAAGARSIAAVTTTADGSTRPGSPERVFVNPRVFDPLPAPARQVVLRHEATHVAVAAAASDAPLWLTEGFADWVALSDSPLPVRALASQAVALVRTRGAPRHLPGRAEFAADAPDLGAAYESAWLAVRLIARDHGAPALLRFQRLADRGGGVRQAFRVALGTTPAAFTREWRRELVRVAG